MAPGRLARLGHAFADASLLELALTHRSAGHRHNERLEFLGDAVLNLCVSELLYARFPRAPEGVLTRLRAELVRESTLAALARELALGDVLRLGPGELRSGGHDRDSILADGFEAVLGAMYLDGGLEACRRALATLLEERVALLDDAPRKDPKTELQELLQGRGLSLPVYELVRAEGDEHRKRFHARCSVASLALDAEGEGASRRAAETEAARAVLARIAEHPPS